MNRRPINFRRFGLALVAALVMAPTSASAITAELAKKCRALAIKAYPTLPAGTRNGSAESQREFYLRCVERDGDIEVPAPVPLPAPKPAPAAAPRSTIR
jgi:hypothetical protein